MGLHPERLVLELEWVLGASPERVFRLLTVPEELVKWWGPTGFTTPEVDWRPVVGGRYRLGMQPPAGDLFHLAGEFLDVRPPSRLAYTFRWEEPDPDDRETEVRLTVAAAGEHARLSLSHGDFATPARLALHRDGWSESIVKLARVAAEEP
jgi:uncharacterized protein YndB with AHSA1/START domain